MVASWFLRNSKAATQSSGTTLATKSLTTGTYRFTDFTLGANSALTISGEVNRILGHRKGIRPSERIHAITLVDDEFKVEDGTLTPTLKMRRDRILKRHEKEVEALFAEA